MTNHDAQLAGIGIQIVQHTRVLNPGRIGQATVRMLDRNRQLALQQSFIAGSRNICWKLQRRIAGGKLRESSYLVSTERTGWRKGERSPAGHASARKLELRHRIAEQLELIAGKQIGLLNGNRVAIDPERLQLQKVSSKQLGLGRLNQVNGRVTGDNPDLVIKRDVEMKVCRSVLGPSLNVVDDEANVLGSRLQRNVVVGPIGVRARLLNRSAAEISGIGGCVVEGIDGPIGVVAVWPEEVDARNIRRNRGILVRSRVRLSRRKPHDAGDLPIFISLGGGIYDFIWTGVFISTVMNDDSHIG